MTPQEQVSYEPEVETNTSVVLVFEGSGHWVY